jgi:hypothetical protein
MNTTLHGRNEGRLLLLAVRCLMSRFVMFYVVILQIKSNLEMTHLPVVLRVQEKEKRNIKIFSEYLYIYNI